MRIVSCMGLVTNTVRFAQSPRCRQTLLGFLGPPVVAFWVEDDLSWAREYLQWLVFHGPKYSNRNFAAIVSLDSRRVETWSLCRRCNSECRRRAKTTSGHTSRPSSLGHCRQSEVRTTHLSGTGLILRYPVPPCARCEVALAKMSQQSHTRP